MFPESVSLGEALAVVAAVTPDQFERFCQSIDPAWVEEALLATGTATIRRRRLPAQQVIWLVLGMALMRDRPIVDVVDKLDLALPSPNGPVAPSAVFQARARLGAAPLEWLFLRCAQQWAHQSADQHRWRGLALYGADGTSARVPDSPENRAHFGGQRGRNESQSGYPLVRMACLMVLRSHLIVAASFGPYAAAELSYAEDLWPLIPDHSLTVVDRGFFAAHILIPLGRDGTNRHWLTRAKKNQKWRTVERLGVGDELVEMTVSREARRKDPTLPQTWRLRAIRYHRRGFRPQILLTSLTDATAYPRDEIVALYHERWELELGYDEIKTEMLERQETIRSKSPKLVEQEIWGLLLAYNLVRLEMERIADEAKVEPTRISFVAALRYIRDEWFWLEGTRSPGAIPRHLAQMRANIARFILPQRRTRSYPRAVKLKMSNYDRKRPPTDRSAK